MMRRFLAMLPPLLAAVSAFAQSSGNVVVSVDPAGTFTGSWAVEWNTNDNFEGWSPVNATATITNGVLEGTATATDSRVQLAGFAGGPDLNPGFNDFLELRIQVPASYTNSIQIFYGTTLTAGFNTTTRVLTIPASLIPDDGAFHTYRLDLGLEVYWRATLRDLRIDAVDGADATGMTFAIDYLRIGDAPGAAVYQPRITTECPAAGGSTPGGAFIGPGQTVSSMESKHFRFLWNAAVTSNGSWTATMAQGTLRNAEECWQILCKKLGYREPCFATGTTNGTRYKVNITTWHSGYWAGLDGSYGRLNITPDGLRVDPPTGVLPHEFTHVIQFHNSSSYIPGSWWEGHANYGRERYLQHFGALFPANQRSGIDPTYLRCAHQILAHGRDYYLSWPMFLYLDENPDGLSDLGEGTNVKLWQQTQINEYPLMALERLTPTNSLKDIVGNFARRGATYNYSTKTDIQAALASFGPPLDNAATARWQFTDLVQRSDDTNWWRVPYEMAPMQGAYAIHELVPFGSGAGRVVAVDFRGLPDNARGADWRASFIVISDSGAERYSTLWSNGLNSVTLAANENKVYLSVAGAPATFHTGAPNGNFEGDFNDALYPYRSWPSKTRFPYELQVVAGATPKVRDNGSPAGLTQHSNGGGYRSVSVPASVYIGPNARVLGGTVSGNARIEDYAVVSAGTVNGNAVISGHAWVRGGTVTGNAKVRDWALVEGGTISVEARVLERANIKGGTVTDTAVAKGTAASLSGTLFGNAIIEGDYGDFFSGRSITNGIAFGHQPYVGVPDSFIRPLPTGLYAAYDFAAAHSSRILDQYGVTDGFMQGNPTWYSGDGKRSGFLAFNGSSQYVNLDRSLGDVRQCTLAAWVKWSGGAANQPVFYLGAATNKCLYLTPDNGAGQAAFTAVNGAVVQTLAWTNALPVGAWAHVAVTLDGTNATLYVNGELAATAASTNRADLFLAANTATAAQHNYLARGPGNALPFFRGALDDVQCYATALNAAAIAAFQPVTSFTGPGTLYVDLRATNGIVSSTWTNLGTLGHFTAINGPTYSTNVSGTGVPGMSFNGTTAAFNGPNTVPDLDGASDRSIEVWAYNPSLAAEETTVSWGHRWSQRQDCAFNFGNNATWGAATHWDDDVGWGTAPTANAWHHLVYTYSNSVVRVYVDGTLRNTKTLAGPLNTFASEPINIGCQREAANGLRSLFYSGSINAVRVWGGEMTATQVAQNYQFGPWTLPGASGMVTLAPIANVTTNTGVTLNITNVATDPNLPPLPLTFSIVAAPTGAVINVESGLFTWRPAIAQAGQTNLITLMVQNSATPSLSATQSFVATINAVASPAMSDVQLTDGVFGFLVSGDVGPDYLIQTSTNLSDWDTILNTNPVALPFLWTNSISLDEPVRFHRIQLGP
jgi:hypothetical protein